MRGLQLLPRALGVVAIVGMASALGACGTDDPTDGTTARPDTTLSTGLTLPEPTPGVEPPAGVEVFDGLSNQHVDTPVVYPHTPPVGGEHAFPPFWQNCRFYDSPVPSEHAVHSMEHGAVWITYSPDLPLDQVALLAQLAADYVLISEFDGLPSPIVASAWGRQLQVSAATDVALVDFVEAFANGPQTPEPGAPCSGGTDSLTLGE